MDFIVLFDFDWSLINCDSDRWVVEHQGALALMSSLRRSVPWTELMDRIMVFTGSTPANVKLSLEMIPLDSAMVRAIKTIASAGYDLQIISDANTFFINTVLENFQIRHCFSQVHSNVAQADPSSGLLRIKAYQPQEQPHACHLCPPNMCKGLILETIRAGRQENVIYIGDGNGDVCPSLKLQEDDHILARENFPLAKFIQESPHSLKATFHSWNTPTDLVEHLLTILKMI